MSASREAASAKDCDKPGQLCRREQRLTVRRLRSSGCLYAMLKGRETQRLGGFRCASLRRCQRLRAPTYLGSRQQSSGLPATALTQLCLYSVGKSIGEGLWRRAGLPPSRDDGRSVVEEPARQLLTPIDSAKLRFREPSCATADQHRI